jgi:hypothetical protein
VFVLNKGAKYAAVIKTIEDHRKNSLRMPPKISFIVKKTLGKPGKSAEIRQNSYKFSLSKNVQYVLLYNKLSILRRLKCG